MYVIETIKDTQALTAPLQFAIINIAQADREVRDEAIRGGKKEIIDGPCRVGGVGLFSSVAVRLTRQRPAEAASPGDQALLDLDLEVGGCYENPPLRNRCSLR